MTTIPLWIVASLGKYVSVACDIEQPDGLIKIEAGRPVKLQGIDAGEDGIPYAIVQLEPTDPCDLENVHFHDLMSLGPVSFSLDMEQGTIATR